MHEQTSPILTTMLQMKLKSGLIALTLFSAALVQTGCNTEAKNSDDGQKKDSTVVVPVESATVVRGDIGAWYQSTAVLEAKEEAIVLPKVGGEITELYVEEGDKVEKGALLATLDDRQYKLEIERAKANLSQLTNDLKRSKDLFDKGLISAKEYEDTKYQHEAQKAALNIAQLNQSFTQIKAPISGVISYRYVKTGNTVGTSNELFKITNFDPLHGIVHIPENELHKIKKGQKVEIQADAVPRIAFTGNILRISPVIDPTSGTFKTTVEVYDESMQLKPGMFVRMNIQYDKRENTLLVRKEAIMREDESSSVYVIKDGQTFKRPVKTGYSEQAMVEIMEGLNDGDSVVTVGQSSLQDSTTVHVIALQ
jgi:membrane fusion protein (multidrug efflux system)